MAVVQPPQDPIKVNLGKVNLGKVPSLKKLCARKIRRSCKNFEEIATFFINPHAGYFASTSRIAIVAFRRGILNEMKRRVTKTLQERLSVRKRSEDMRERRGTLQTRSKRKERDKNNVQELAKLRGTLYARLYLELLDAVPVMHSILWMPDYDVALQRKRVSIEETIPNLRARKVQLDHLDGETRHLLEQRKMLLCGLFTPDRRRKWAMQHFFEYMSMQVERMTWGEYNQTASGKHAKRLRACEARWKEDYNTLSFDGYYDKVWKVQEQKLGRKRRQRSQCNELADQVRVMERERRDREGNGEIENTIAYNSVSMKLYRLRIELREMRFLVDGMY